MKKTKQISLVRTLIAAALLLIGSSGGVAWGQAYIGGPAGVKNIFGAGESARLNGNNVVFPSGAIRTIPDDIEISTGVGNIVINSYNAGGKYTNYTNWWSGTWSGSGSGGCSSNHYPSWTDNSIHWSGVTAQITPDYTDPCSGHTHAHPSGVTSDPYTSDQWGAADDGILLVQTRGSQIINDGTYNSRSTAKTSGGGLDDYKRPTTIAIEGKTTIDKIKIGDLRWYYRTFEVTTQDVELLSGCRTGGSCQEHHHSTPPYTTWSASASYHKHQHKSHTWDTQGNHLGNTLLDAGVLILNGAEVCVNNDIKDVTGNGLDARGNGVGAQSSFTTSSTEGVLIWPETGNFTLRVKNLGKISMAHSNPPSSGTTDHNNPYFMHDQFIALPVQNTSGNMYLYKSDGTSFPFLNTDNLPATNHGYRDISDLYASTPASILGLRGHYDRANAIVHTTGAAVTDKHGVIEVGSTTTGQDRFVVYSGGVIKNYSTTACNAVKCAPVNFGTGNVPTFKFNGSEPLYILNDGDSTGCCNAAINFNAGGIGPVVTGVHNASNPGDLLIRAHHHVFIKDAAAFAPPANQNNNISILSDKAYIKTDKAFSHTAAGGGEKGQLTLWAKGTPKNQSGCGGAVTITGALTTTSDFNATTNWQNLRDALLAWGNPPTGDAMNSNNLARSVNCNTLNEEISARTSGALNTGVQTRIQSDKDSIVVTGDFTHTGKNGGLLIQANRSVTVGPTTKIDFRTKSGVGDAVIQSRNSSVNFAKFNYTGHEKTDLFIDGETGVNFYDGGTIDYQQASDNIDAHTGIQSNAGSIWFGGNPFEFKNHSHGNTQLWAGVQITNTVGAPLTFTFTKTNTDNKQNIDLYAGNAIKMYGDVTFKHDDADDHKGFIKLRANTNEEQLWNEQSLSDLVMLPGLGHCPSKCTTDDVGDIDLRANTTILYKGKPTVWMAADHDIDIRQNYVHIAGSASQTDQGPTRIVAGHDIITGANTTHHPNNYSTTTFFYNHVGKGNKGHFDMKAGHDIITNNKVILGYSPQSETVHTTLFACNNIDIRNAFTYGDSVPSGNNKDKWTRLYAWQDILTNYPNGSCPPSTSPGAPVNYYTPNNTLTDWNAGRNIITGDSVNFRYGVTGNSVRPLYIVAQGGNIEMKRWTNIDYDSKDTVLISAERHQAYSKAKAHGRSVTNGPKVNGTPTEANRFITDGHIYFGDSLKITRNNAPQSTEDGVTNIFADYHIRTAMVDITNTKPANRNKTTIESHKGDIWLGYSVAQDACQYPAQGTVVTYDNNLFHYKDAANTDKQSLKIRAGYQDQADSNRYNGGNIYIVQMKNELTKGGTTNTEITIPFSNEYKCGSTWSGGLLHNRQKDTMMMYEHAGIIFGLGHCGKDKDIAKYAPAQGTGNGVSNISLTYLGNKGNLLVDAGKRGNIIINKGANLNFQDTLNMTGDAIFRTRFGDIDMREKFDADTMRGSLLFLAQTENLSDLSKIGICGCEEERNNVYLQDFQYRSHMAGGSVFVGADNNIKLNYGGLQNIGTRHDPFLSKDYTVCPDGKLAKIGYGYDGASCNDDDLHCDAVEPVNKARKLILNFEKDDQNKAITKGGFAAVASDYIDVYKKMVYRGGRGSGMSSVPGTGTLHGETVNGYGLFMKTQANKNNWTINIFKEIPKCPTTCAGDNCDRDYLHMVSRMTFHDEADIQAHNQKVMLWSPVVETYGKMTLDTKTNSGNNTEITLKADSLIFHDDFVKIGNKTKLSTWSGLKNDKPIMKFGHMRKTPPFRELKKDNCQTEIECIPCHYYIRGSKDPVHMLDTITIKFGDDAYLERLNTVVFDHTVLTCLTDSFDHIKGAPVLNAQVRTDTLKIRNQVDLFADKNHERDAHLELISERQMGSKDYAGIYTKHLHMEPVGACGTPYSELWTSDDLALDVITTSIFGGFGFIHSDVHVENGAHLNAGFTSLRLRGLCYEQLCGTQRMKDLRLDVGAQLHFSVGTTKGLNGEYSDAIEVEKLTTYGSVDVNIEIRPCEKIEKRCYPIIYYKSLTPNSLNNLKVKPAVVKIDDEEYPLHLNIGTDGIVYVCVGDAQPVDLTRTVTIPSVTGVTTDPVPGIWEVKSRGNFKFKATFSGTKPLAVRTSRMVNGAPEMLTGKKNANGEYEYVIPHVQEDITLTIGPDFVANELLAGTAVWSHGEMIYIRVDRADIASIYSVAGQLVRKIDLPEGDTSIPMSRGAYVITLKDGSVHKVIVK